MSERIIVAGVDGCPAGSITTSSSPCGMRAVVLPLGPPAGAARPPEREVRARLGDRRSSVFSVPSHESIQCLDYREACRINLLHSDPLRRVSKQCFHLFPKMREIDALITPEHQSRIYESHPELAFWVMNGETPLPLAKKARSESKHPGLDLRKSLLARNGLPVDSLTTDYRRRDVGADDLIDACACTLVAWRILNRRSIRFPANPTLNARGLRMEINA